MPSLLHKGLAVAVIAVPCSAQSLLIPSDVVNGNLTVSQHPHAAVINDFLQDQAAHPVRFTPTGLSRRDYLPVIDSITRAMKTLQNSAGRIIDPTPGLNREHQYSTAAYAHCVATLFKSGYVPMSDTALLNSGYRAMSGAVTAMTTNSGNSVPDSHGDFFTVLIMQAYENFKGVADSARLATWRSGMASINTGNVYKNSAPNWIGFNIAGEFLRFKEGLTTVNWTQSRLAFQTTRMGKDGLYQDVNTIDTATSPVANIDGNSIAYDNVARGVLSTIARGGYAGTGAADFSRALWKGGWTSLLYQSPAGEVPTGMRSSHHLWNEGFAAINYEMWAREYALAGKPAVAGAFKRAAHLSLMSHKQWLTADGSGYITKARYPFNSKWGYMTYSGRTNYNTLAASALATAWAVSDSTIAERPAPADVGGFVLPILPGFKKIFANAGGTYAEFDVRGDQSHNPTGLIRAHLNASLPQLGPSDGVIGTYNPSAQYRPLYPTADPAGLPSTGIGPGWLVNGAWKTLGAMTQIPTVTILEQTPTRASFRLRYTIDSSSILHETVVVEPSGITVTDSIEGGGINGLRVYYPMLVTDGEMQTTVSVSGASATLLLRGKGARFSMVRPANATLTRTNVERNHRNGRAEVVYADVPARVAEYKVTAWPVYVPVGLRPRAAARANGPVIGYDGAFLQVEENGAHRSELVTLAGRRVWSGEGTGPTRYDLRGVGAGQGMLFLRVSDASGTTVRKLLP